MADTDNKVVTGASISALKTWVKSQTGGGLTGYTVKTMTGVGNTGWTNNATDDKILASQSMLAFWNGAYSGASSNLAYLGANVYAANGSGTFHGTANKATADANGNNIASTYATKSFPSTWTLLGSFTASTGAHTITSVANYAFIGVRIGQMWGIFPKSYLRPHTNSEGTSVATPVTSSATVSVFSEESWMSLYMTSNTSFRIKSNPNHATETCYVYGFV